MTMPPKMLTARMIRPAIASPRTNFEAPSIEPKKALSSSSSRRRCWATFSSISPGRQVGVDRHLLAGDGVEGEPRADLGDAGRALGDDEEIDGDQDEEDDHPDDEVAAHHQGGEPADDVAGGGDSLGAVRQDQPRRRDIERQPQDGRHQQDGGKRGKLQRLLIHRRDHQDQHGQRDRQRQPEVDHQRRHGQEEQAQDQRRCRREADVLAAAADVGSRRRRRR